MACLFKWVSEYDANHQLLRDTIWYWFFEQSNMFQCGVKRLIIASLQQFKVCNAIIIKHIFLNLHYFPCAKLAHMFRISRNGAVEPVQPAKSQLVWLKYLVPVHRGSSEPECLWGSGLANRLRLPCLSRTSISLSSRLNLTRWIQTVRREEPSHFYSL